jgi:PAS domain S-box-containing protein
MTRDSPETILILEDEPLVARLEQHRLERAGFHVESVATAEDAFELLRRNEIGLIVLDYQIPRLNGLEFYTQLKATGLNIPVIMVTGYSQDSTIIEALRAGVRDFITKSLEYLDYLPEAVERVLKQVRTEKQLAVSEAKLAGIIASAKDAIIVVESDQRIRLFNAAAETMFQCKSELALGQRLSRFIRFGPLTSIDILDAAPDAAARWAAALETCENGMHLDGSQFPIEAKVSRVEAAGQRLLTVIVRDITERREHIRSIQLAHEEMILRLLAVSALRDFETGAHIRRTGLFSEVLATAAGWDRSRANQLRMAAAMHDVGKIGIPDAILRKPGRLTDEEFEIMKSHCLLGANMLGNSQSSVMQLAQQIAMSHHEHWDGRGYPHGLAGVAIPECARIVAIVDVYDALSHDRVYRPAYSEPEVVSMMLERSSTHFDPHLLECFFSVLPKIRRILQANPDGDLGDAAPSLALRSPAGSTGLPEPRTSGSLNLASAATCRSPTVRRAE